MNIYLITFDDHTEDHNHYALCKTDGEVTQVDSNTIRFSSSGMTQEFTHKIVGLEDITNAPELNVYED